MAKINGGGIRNPALQNKLIDTSKKESVPLGAKQVTQDQILDKFQRSGPNVLAKLSGMNAAELAKHLNFKSTEMAAFAKTFFMVLKENPNADRKERAALFAKAILEKKGLKNKGPLSAILSKEEEESEEGDSRRQALEELFEQIADQLDSTPVFAQLVEEVTESVRKIR